MFHQGLWATQYDFHALLILVERDKPYPTNTRAYVSHLIRDIIRGDLLGKTPSRATPAQTSRSPEPPPADGLGQRRRSYIGNSARPPPPRSRERPQLHIQISHRSPSLSGEPIKILDAEPVLVLHGSRKNSVQPQGQHEGIGIGGKVKANMCVSGMQTGSTAEGSSNSGSFVRFNDAISQEREQLIQYNKLCIAVFLTAVDYAKNKAVAPTTHEYYKFVKLIGKGAFGKVTLGIHKLTGKYVAIKSIDKECLKDEFSKKKVLREIYILKKLRHVNIIRLLEVFETPRHVLIVMEYAENGDLLHSVKQKKRLPEDQAASIFRQVVYGLAHIHSRNVLHRDVKLDNILLDSEGGVKICDFGVSKIIDKTAVIYDQCGTPAYIAPEIISDVGYKGFYVDHWSLGVLLYAMLCGTVPFKATNMEALHEMVKKGKFTFVADISPGNSSHATFTA